MAESSEPIIFEKRVTSGADDVEERQTGTVAIDSSDLELVIDGTKIQTVGIRFTDIDIPEGAVITAAYVQFQADKTSAGEVSLLIRGQDSDDAAAFSTVKFSVSSRPTTDASVSWTPSDWSIGGESGLAQRTPDLSAIVQEIVDRDGWAALNDMVFLITGTGTRRADAFEGSAAGAPLLHIEYYVSPAGDRVAFNDPPDTESAANQIGELAPAGTPVGITATASDPDPGDTVSYSVDDPRFTIDASGVITRSVNGKLDFETEPSIALRVTATSSDGSKATQAFTVETLDEQEPVVFNDPPDADGNPDRIAENVAAGTTVGITASASDPDAGDTVTYGVDDPRFAIDNDGVITRSANGTLNAQTEPSITLNVTATSSDGSTTVESFSLNVTFDTPPPPPTSATLVRTIHTSQWSTPSPDPSGIAYISHLGTLFVSDGEVDEMPNLFTGKNLFEMSLSGALLNSLSTISFSDEPTGVAYNPLNRHLFFTDDTGTRAVYELNPGSDGLYATSDDIVTFFRTRPFGFADTEGLTYDTTRGVLHLVGGTDAKVFTVDPGPNGKFDGVPSEGGDDIVTSFATGPLGISNPEGIEYDPVFDILYITASRNSVAMVTPAGELVGTLDISAAGAKKPAGLALAPSSVDSTKMSLYVVDRGVDNNSNPDENDGKVYEFLFGDWPMV